MAENRVADKHCLGQFLLDIPLHDMLKKAGKTVKAKHNLIAKALKELDILLVISRTAKGQRGVKVTYVWNVKNIGPPSLDLVDKINEHLPRLLANEKIKELKNRSERNPINARRLLVDEGTTSCLSCWMSETPDCRKRLLVMGLDCKVINVNSLRYEEDPAVG